mmetsp:Transcript_39446/g.113356  ORF Transcript_39446/g.113356 Transcript_39446/m.113356 type:complete len:238 (-) Transcript_39446:183-896(-)
MIDGNSSAAALSIRVRNSPCMGKAFEISGKMDNSFNSLAFRTMLCASTVCSQCSVFWPGSFGFAGVPWKQTTTYRENDTSSGSSIWSMLPTSRARALSGGQYSILSSFSSSASPIILDADQCRRTLSQSSLLKSAVALVTSKGSSKWMSLPCCKRALNSLAVIFFTVIFFACNLGIGLTLYFCGVKSFGTSVPLFSSTTLAASNTLLNCWTVLSKKRMTLASSFFSLACSSKLATCS